MAMTASRLPARIFSPPTHDPAGPGADHGGPPAAPVGVGLVRQEAQVVDLLADLNHQGEQHPRGGAEIEIMEFVGVGAVSDERHPLRQHIRLLHENEDEGRDQEDHPDRLRHQLQAADHRDAEEGDRDDHDRRHDISHDDRQAEIDFQRLGHNGRLERKEYESEPGIDEGGDGGADIAEPGAAGQQVHVDVVLAGIVGDRQVGDEHQEADDDDGRKGVGEAVAHGDRGADGLEREEGDAAEGGVGDDERRPLPKRSRGIAEGIVLHRLIGDPGLIRSSRSRRFETHATRPDGTGCLKSAIGSKRCLSDRSLTAMSGGVKSAAYGAAGEAALTARRKPRSSRRRNGSPRRRARSHAIRHCGTAGRSTGETRRRPCRERRRYREG